jgi:hypothetical protein
VKLYVASNGLSHLTPGCQNLKPGAPASSTSEGHRALKETNPERPQASHHNHSGTESSLPSPYSLSYQDYKLYFSCPKKVAFRAMGLKSRTFTRAAPVLPVQRIGMTGEQLTEQMLALIAQVQDKIAKSGKWVAPADVAAEMGDEFVEEELGGLSEEEALEELEEGERQVAQARKTILDRVGENVRLLAAHVPRILTITKPRYRNRDVFTSGFPDFQLETVDGHQIVEVKTLQRPPETVVQDAVQQTQLYLAMLEDDVVSDAVLSLGSALDLLRNSRKQAARLLSVDRVDDQELRRLFKSANLAVPTPPRGLVFLPRQARLVPVDRGLEGFRGVAVEIWKIKHAAVVDGKLPYVERSPALCHRCAFKKHCEEGESLELVPPAPLAFALGEVEVGELKEPSRIPALRDQMEQMIRDAHDKGRGGADFTEEWRQTYDLARYEQEVNEGKRLHAIYREFPDLFEKWGGEGVAHDRRLKQSTHIYYRTDPRKARNVAPGPDLLKGETETLQTVKKRWKL